MLSRLGRVVLRLWLASALVGTIVGAYAEISSIPAEDRSFGLFYASALALRSGGDPHGVFRTLSTGVTIPNLNPPLWFVLFVPITSLPVGLAAAVWAVISIAALIGGLTVVRQDGGIGEWRSWRCLAVLAGPIIWETFAQGQVYTLLVAPLAGGALYLRRQNPLAAAALLGLAIALKPPLFVLVITLFWTSRRLAVWIALASAAWSLLPLPVLGVQPCLGWLRVTQLAPVGAPQNASLTSLALRWGGQPAEVLTMLLVIALAAYVSYRARESRVALALGVAGGLAASPITWPTYFVLLIPGLAWVVRVRPISRLRDGALLLCSCPMWGFLMSPLAVVPIYGIALAGVVAEMSLATLKRAPAETRASSEPDLVGLRAELPLPRPPRLAAVPVSVQEDTDPRP